MEGEGPADPQSLNRYAYVNNNPVRYSDPSGHCIPDECPWVPQVSHPGEYTGPYDESYDAWLVQSILWLEREWAATGGMVGIREAQQSIATELAHRIMHSDDPAVYSQQVLQGLAGTGVDIATWAADKGAAFMSSFAGWVLGQVKGAAKTGRRALPPPIGINPWRGKITSLVLQKDTTMYRVWGGDARRIGAWLTPFRPIDATSARRGLALPPANTAHYVSEVLVPAGTRVQIGVAAPAFGQPGGALQVQLLDRIPPRNFGPGKVLPIGLLPPP